MSFARLCHLKTSVRCVYFIGISLATLEIEATNTADNYTLKDGSPIYAALNFVPKSFGAVLDTDALYLMRLQRGEDGKIDKTAAKLILETVRI